ncbi:hypothetical protein A2U01_0114579, partial [Trifolium medium]|nr:hypothetical protein [Trifolium medium]
ITTNFNSAMNSMKPNVSVNNYIVCTCIGSNINCTIATASAGTPTTTQPFVGGDSSVSVAILCP